MSQIDDFRRQLQEPRSRTIGLGVVGLVLIVAVFGRDAVTYVRTFADRATEDIRSGISVQFELERARGMVRELLPEIHTAMLAVAEDEVLLDHSRREVTDAEDALNRQKQELLRLRADLENETGAFKVGERNATPAEVREELKRRFSRYQTCEATLDVKRQITAARNQSLRDSQKTLQELLNAREDFRSEIEQLEARIRRQELTRENTESDRSQIVRCQTLIDDIRRRLDVADRMVAAKVPLEDVLLTGYLHADTDISHEIDEYLRGQAEIPKEQE